MSHMFGLDKRMYFLPVQQAGSRHSRVMSDFVHGVVSPRVAMMRGGVSGVAAGGGGDVRVTGGLEGSDGEVAEGGHDAGAVAGARAWEASSP